jgi:hypothetical protein
MTIITKVTRKGNTTRQVLCSSCDRLYPTEDCYYNRAGSKFVVKLVPSDGISHCDNCGQICKRPPMSIPLPSLW